MHEPFWFPPSRVAAGVRIVARCPRCLHTRDLDLPALIAAGDRPLRSLEGRLRCKSRGRDGRQSVCGGRGELDIIAPTLPGEDGLTHFPSVVTPAA